jgi:hypothetical protein
VSSDYDIIDLSRPGWVADPQSISEIAEKLERYCIENDDFVIVDALSNSCVKGTDPDGNQIAPYKDRISGKWHVPGELNLAPKPALKKILAQCGEKWFKNRAPKLIGIVPIPRYVAGKCCLEQDHISNFADPDYVTDLESGLETLEDLVIGWVQKVNERLEVFNFRTCTEDPNDSLPDLQINGRPIWCKEDPVHAIPDLNSEAAITIMGAISSDSDFDAQLPAKRPRVESVIVRRAGESSKPRGKPASASWSTCTLPPPRGKSWRPTHARQIHVR